MFTTEARHFVLCRIRNYESFVQCKGSAKISTLLFNELSFEHKDLFDDALSHPRRTNFSVGDVTSIFGGSSLTLKATHGLYFHGFTFFSVQLLYTMNIFKMGCFSEIYLREIILTKMSFSQNRLYELYTNNAAHAAPLKATVFFSFHRN